MKRELRLVSTVLIYSLSKARMWKKTLSSSFDQASAGRAWGEA